jgi:hypothetical protein
LNYEEPESIYGGYERPPEFAQRAPPLSNTMVGFKLKFQYTFVSEKFLSSFTSSTGSKSFNTSEALLS